MENTNRPTRPIQIFRPVNIHMGVTEGLTEYIHVIFVSF